MCVCVFILIFCFFCFYFEILVKRIIKIKKKQTKKVRLLKPDKQRQQHHREETP